MDWWGVTGHRGKSSNPVFSICVYLCSSVANSGFLCGQRHPQGDPLMSVQPEKIHVAKELKYGKPLVSCRFDPAGKYVYAGSEDDTVQRWDLNADPARAKPVAFAAHDGWVFALDVSPDGRTLLSGGPDGKLIWWPAAADVPKPV